MRLVNALLEEYLEQLGFERGELEEIAWALMEGIPLTLEQQGILESVVLETEE